MMPVRLIDANALFNDLKESAKYAREWREETQDEEIKIRAEQALRTFIECALRVKHAPTIEAKPVRRGHWILLEGWFNKSVVKCSTCGNTLDMDGVNAGRGDANFCPNCGARMDVPDINVGDIGGADNG